MTALSTAIPPQNVPIVQNNGTISLPWLRFLQNLQGASGPGSLTVLEAEVAALTTEVGNIASEVSQAVSEASAAQAAASIGQALGAVALRAAPPPLKTFNSSLLTSNTTSLTFSGAGVTTSKVGGDVTVTISGGGGGGGVSSVGLTAPSQFTVSGSPVTSSGTLNFSWNAAPANQVFAGPISGANNTPAFRALVSADIPTIANTQVSGLGTMATQNASAVAITSGTAALTSATVGGQTVLTDQGAWTAWTPTLTPQSGTITSATAGGRYQQIGRLVYFRANISITNAGSASGYLEFTLPVSALDANWAGCGYESAVTGDMIRVAGVGTTQGVLFLYSGSTAVTVTGYGITISGFYEAATG